MDEQKIKELIEVYKQQRDQIIHQANLQVAELTGAIKALEALLKDSEQQASSNVH